MRRPRVASRRAGVVLAAAVLTGSGLAAVAPAAQAGVITVSPTGTFRVLARGNGHGHGMSQYGAHGAATIGRTYQQILAFYYAGTTLTTLPSATTIRVRLSDTGSTTTVAPYADLTVTGVPGALPTTAVRRYRLVADAAAGTTLQRLTTATGAAWTVVKAGLPNRAQFHRTGWGAIRVFQAGYSTDYRGYLGAVRVNPRGTAGGVRTVERVGINRYTAGVVPREVPASWPRAAVNAQAVAARTYGRYAVVHPAGSDYDICDSSQCQVYGGQARFSASGALQLSQYLPAATDTSNKVLTFLGAPIFAQFSSSNGGWSVDGGLPYLKAVADPYDPLAGNPYINYSTTVRVASVAAHFGLATVTELEITKRDGRGTWGGRVLQGFVDGKNAAGQTRRISVTGFDLASAFGVNTTWFSLRSS